MNNLIAPLALLLAHASLISASVVVAQDSWVGVESFAFSTVKNDFKSVNCLFPSHFDVYFARTKDVTETQPPSINMFTADGDVINDSVSCKFEADASFAAVGDYTAGYSARMCNFPAYDEPTFVFQDTYAAASGTPLFNKDHGSIRYYPVCQQSCAASSFAADHEIKYGEATSRFNAKMVKDLVFADPKDCSSFAFNFNIASRSLAEKIGSEDDRVAFPKVFDGLTVDSSIVKMDPIDPRVKFTPNNIVVRLVEQESRIPIVCENAPNGFLIGGCLGFKNCKLPLGTTAAAIVYIGDNAEAHSDRIEYAYQAFAPEFANGSTEGCNTNGDPIVYDEEGLPVKGGAATEGSKYNLIFNSEEKNCDNESKAKSKANDVTLGICSSTSEFAFRLRDTDIENQYAIEYYDSCDNSTENYIIGTTFLNLETCNASLESEGEKSTYSIPTHFVYISAASSLSPMIAFLIIASLASSSTFLWN